MFFIKNIIAQFKFNILLKTKNLGECLDFMRLQYEFSFSRNDLVSLIVVETNPEVLCRIIMEQYVYYTNMEPSKIVEATRKQFIQIGDSAVPYLITSVQNLMKQMDQGFALSGYSGTAQMRLACLCIFLGDIKDRRAIPILLDVVKKSLSVVARVSAAQSLGNIGNNEVANNLTECLKKIQEGGGVGLDSVQDLFRLYSR